jgi:AcrR family transcriptional regulator
MQSAPVPPVPRPAEEPCRPLRADAERNRLRVLAAAREAFATDGLGVSLDEVAERAGLGVATVYRRFPNREALIEALFAEELDDLCRIAHDALADPDPWGGFVLLLERSCERLVADRALRHLFFGSTQGRDMVVRARRALTPLTAGVVDRAQQAGQLRGDVCSDDVPALLLMVSSLADLTVPVDETLWRRYLALLLDGLAVGRTSVLPTPPLSLLDAALAAARR